MQQSRSNILYFVFCIILFFCVARFQKVRAYTDKPPISTTSSGQKSSEAISSFNLELNLDDSYKGFNKTHFQDSLIGSLEKSLPKERPDSLKTIDPFLYKYYFAVKDSLTHVETKDSLISVGDTLIWPKIDSLYIQDSIQRSKIAFEKWFKSLDKKGKRKYYFEQSMLLKQKRQDSILARKDSIKHLRDSILQETPRILHNTFALADSMQYKRIITWTHDRYVNRLNVSEIDTSYNYHFNDFPFLRSDVAVNWLGVPGSPVQSRNFFKRRNEESFNFYESIEPWTYTPSNLNFYNTKTPHTELAYYGSLLSKGEKSNDNIRIFTTQNITPELNFAVEYNRYGGGGMLLREATKNKTFVLSSNYLGKKYLMHSAYIYNMASFQENGGILDNKFIRDTTVESREIAIALKDAKNLYKKHSLFIDQSYKIDFDFFKSTRKTNKGNSPPTSLPAEKKDTANLNDHTAMFVGHASEYSVFRKIYTDRIEATDALGRNFYKNQFYSHPIISRDSIRTMKFDNRFFVRLQPYKKDAIISKLDFGIGDRLLSWYNFNPGNYFSITQNELWNSLYAYAGAEGYASKYLKWNAFGSYTFLGTEINNFTLHGSALVSIYPFSSSPKSPLNLRVNFESRLYEPDYFEQKYYSNHYKWDNSFKKKSITKVQAGIAIPYTSTNFDAAYALLKNHTYYDNDIQLRQADNIINVLTLSCEQNFSVANFLHLDHRLLLQFSSDALKLPLPLFAAYLRYYVQFNVKKDVLQVQLGSTMFFNTSFYYPAWNPALGQWYNQNEIKYGNSPYFELFLNMQWKRACIFVKWENAGMGWPLDKADYFASHHRIYPQRKIKFGIFWPFYTQVKKQSTFSSRTSSSGL